MPESMTRCCCKVANTYLYNLNDCTNGVKYYQELLALQPDNCDAKKSLRICLFRRCLQ